MRLPELQAWIESTPLRHSLAGDDRRGLGVLPCVKAVTTLHVSCAWAFNTGSVSPVDISGVGGTSAERRTPRTQGSLAAANAGRHVPRLTQHKEPLQRAQWEPQAIRSYFALRGPKSGTHPVEASAALECAVAGVAPEHSMRDRANAGTQTARFLTVAEMGVVLTAAADSRCAETVYVGTHSVTCVRPSHYVPAVTALQRERVPFLGSVVCCHSCAYFHELSKRGAKLALLPSMPSACDPSQAHVLQTG